MPTLYYLRKALEYSSNRSTVKEVGLTNIWRLVIGVPFPMNFIIAVCHCKSTVRLCMTWGYACVLGSACLYLCSIILAAYYRLLGSGYDWQVPCTKSVQASHSSPTVYCLLFLQLLTWKDCSCSLRNIGSSAVKLYSLLEWLSQYGCGTHTDTTFCMCSACTCM